MLEGTRVSAQLGTAEGTQRLDGLLLSTVDGTLKQIFSESGTRVIYDYMQKACCLRLDGFAC